MSKYCLGWKKQKDDSRDIKYKAIAYDGLVLPTSYSLQSRMPFVYQQGQLGSCTSQGIAALIEYDVVKQGLPAFTPSRLFIYYNERDMEGNVNEDSGASIRDGIKSINDIGVCSEALWPYDINKFANRPDDVCYTDGKQNKSLLYSAVNQTEYSLNHAIYHGYPIVFGFKVYENFENDTVATTGVMAMPVGSDIGGHCVVIVGYDDDKRVYRIRNSWGPQWGLQGYFDMPYEYMLRADLANDFWIIETMV